ncbi:YHYH protein [Ichthyenterobacterium sp. W332]|uniref:YHYH protein n=1 Tax=Microcosmobacter mediterraneus TaxID=3075607 RepID=A0ABU2YGJ1_9FLAO|nr:YHYH protein [Ichthyenterobacterium sp. W332]MDT0557304.1 YHYH protein [Ichthyenterobacterium sp. W332]
MKYFTVVCCLILMSCNSKVNRIAEVHRHSNAQTHNHDNYFGDYVLKDENYGTNTVVNIDDNLRIMVTNALPNHKTGDFPNQGNPNSISEQNRTYTFPISPKFTGKAQWMREPGVALNGVKFEPGTAEVVACDTGENFRVEALQDVIDLGLDFNYAHVQPTGAYHYHGTPTSVIKDFDSGEDLVHIGFAHDGFPMYYSKSGKYKPSYRAIKGNREGEDCTYTNPHQSLDISVGGHHDGTFTSDFEYVEGEGDLDECNGIIVDGNYMYLVTKEFPYVSRCLMGEVSQNQRQEPPNTRGRDGEEGRRGGPPSFADLLEMMDKNNDGKLSASEVEGPLKNDFDKVDKNDDGFITENELKSLKRSNQKGQRPPRRRQ